MLVTAARLIALQWTLTATIGAIFASADEAVRPARAVGERLSARLAARDMDAARGRPELRLVYFHAADQEPLTDYGDRWQRILDDIRSFYRDEMERNGFGPVTFDYERGDDGRPRFHVVTGRHPSARYSYDTGRAILAELRDKLGPRVDFDESYTLVVHGLCDEVGDREFRIHAPYYGEGWSSWLKGMCHVADCPLLDPLLLIETESRVKYWEHTGSFDQTTANFNTKYLGGVAHELGHGFALPHNAERPGQRNVLGPALMGSGNHTYRRDVWSDQPGGFLTLASAVRLAAHPLFGGYSREHHDDFTVNLTDVTFDDTDEGVRLRGKIDADIEPIAAILFADPAGGSNYDAQVSVAEVVDGRFACEVNFERLRDGELQLAVVLSNGAAPVVWRSHMETRRGRVDSSAVLARVAIREVERLYFVGEVDEAKTRARDAAREFAQSDHAAFLTAVAEDGLRPAVMDLADIKVDKVSLAEVAWDAAEVGWMRPARNVYAGEPQSRRHRFVQIDGLLFSRGLYAHAPSRYSYRLDGKWSRLHTKIGFQDGGRSEAIWKVIGDGEVLITSKPLGPGRRETWDVDVSGVDELELVIESTRSSNGQCWTVWGDPRLTR